MYDRRVWTNNERCQISHIPDSLLIECEIAIRKIYEEKYVTATFEFLELTICNDVKKILIDIVLLDGNTMGIDFGEGDIIQSSVWGLDLTFEEVDKKIRLMKIDQILGKKTHYTLKGMENRKGSTQLLEENGYKTIVIESEL